MLRARYRREGSADEREAIRARTLRVAVIRSTRGDLELGERVRVVGRATEFIQTVESLQIEHRHVERAERGSEVALKAEARVRRKGQIFQLSEE